MEVHQAKRPRIERQQISDYKICITKHLNDDCFLHIFQYLELNELCVVGRACKKFKQLINGLVERNFRERFMMTEVHIRSTFNQGIVLDPTDEYVAYFLKFMQNVKFGADFGVRPLDVANFMYKNCNETFKLMTFHRIKFEPFHGALIEDWLSTVEGLTFFDCTKLHQILKHCSNLKKLKVDKYSNDLRDRSMNQWTNRWMDHKYPTLKHLQFDIRPNEKLIEFLVQNPNVKELTLNLCSIDIRSIQEFMQQLCTIELEKLQITFDGFRDFRSVKHQLDAICNGSGFTRLELRFKHFYNSYSQSEIFHDLTKLFGLHILQLNRELSSGVISEHVKVLQLGNAWGDLWINFPNLEELYMSNLYERFGEVVTPLVQHCAKLKKIVADGVKVANLVQVMKHWNVEREKLRNACRLVVYIDEDAYDRSTDKLMAGFRWVQLKGVNCRLRDVNFIDPFLVNSDI